MKRKSCAKIREKRLFFSTLELLIAFSLLMTIGSSLAFGFHQAIQQERFQAAVQQLSRRLNLFEELIVLFDSDGEAEVSVYEGKPFLSFELNLPLTPALRARLQPQMLPFTAVRQLYPSTNEEGAISLQFLGGCSYILPAILEVEAPSLSAQIIIPSEPLGVKASFKGRQKEALYDDELAAQKEKLSDALFPQEIFKED